MTGIVIPEEEIGSAGTGGPGDPCNCKERRWVRGKYQKIKECRHQSGLFYLLESEGDYRIVAITDVMFNAGRFFSASSIDTLTLNTQADLQIHATDEARLATDAVLDLIVGEFGRLSGGPLLLGSIPAPLVGDKAARLQLEESAESGIYLGNTHHPGKKVLDWYEESPDYGLTLAAGGSALSGASLQGRFVRIGKLCHAHGSLSFQTPPAGGDAWSFSLPFPPAPGVEFCGSARLVLGGLHRMGGCFVKDGRLQIMTRKPSPGIVITAAQLTGGVDIPFTGSKFGEEILVTTTSCPWAAGDTLSFSISYETAD